MGEVGDHALRGVAARLASLRDSRGFSAVSVAVRVVRARLPVASNEVMAEKVVGDIEAAGCRARVFVGGVAREPCRTWSRRPRSRWARSARQQPPRGILDKTLTTNVTRSLLGRARW
jgi:hypothetical protein